MRTWAPSPTPALLHVLFGSGSHLTGAGSQMWSQDSAGVLDDAEAADHFGMGLGVGDFNGDNRLDLVLCLPHENVSGVDNAGAVGVLYNSVSGLTAAGNQFWTQDSRHPGRDRGERPVRLVLRCRRVIVVHSLREWGVHSRSEWTTITRLPNGRGFRERSPVTIEFTKPHRPAHRRRADSLAVRLCNIFHYFEKFMLFT